MNIQNRFILSNKGLRYFGNGDSELVKGYYGVVTDFNPKTDTTVKFQLKKVYGSITFVINNYIDEHVVIDVVGTGDYPALYLEGGGALPYDIKRVEENTNCTIDITNNVLTYTIPLSYNNQVSSYYGGRLSEAYEAANNGEDFSVDYPVSVSFKSSTSSSVPYIPVYSDTVSVKRGENVLIELDLNNIDSSTGFEFELEP